jgi:hypothetical protein
MLLAAAVGCKKTAHYTDERVAQEVTCINNLKQFSIGFRLWSGDHGDKNPFELSTNAGGVMELVFAMGGFRQNGHLIFQCMSNELTVPLLVVCPQDKTKHAAADCKGVR